MRGRCKRPANPDFGPSQDFIIKEKIGSGSYGVVFKVVRKVDRVTYAMKEIDLQGMSRKEQEECIRETRVLSSLDSDFIIKYYDSFLERVSRRGGGPCSNPQLPASQGRC